MIYYFAYGSNLHPLRLTERVASANLVGTAQVSGYQLKFHKLGQDDSAKCNLFYTGNTRDTVHGAIYTLAAAHKDDLDKYEGKGMGYTDSQIEIPHAERTIHCFTYLAQETYIVDSLQPFHWYKQLVLQGAHYLGFPGSYLSYIEAVVSFEDPHKARRSLHQDLLNRMTNQRRSCDSAKSGENT